MSYSTRSAPNLCDMTKAENHAKVILEVVQLDGPDDGMLVDVVERTVMSDDGKLYVRYKGKKYQLKKMRKFNQNESWDQEHYELVLVPAKPRRETPYEKW